MSFVTTQPEALAAAAGSLHGIGSAMSAPTKHVTCNSIARGDRCGNGPGPLNRPRNRFRPSARLLGGVHQVMMLVLVPPTVVRFHPSSIHRRRMSLPISPLTVHLAERAV